MELCVACCQCCVQLSTSCDCSNLGKVLTAVLCCDLCQNCGQECGQTVDCNCGNDSSNNKAAKVEEKAPLIKEMNREALKF